MKLKNHRHRHSSPVFVYSAVFLGILLLTFSCDFLSDDGGGEGADFDVSLYYTKAEVDAMLPVHGGNPIIGLDGTNNSYDNGVSITVPDGYRYVLVQLSGGDAATTSDIHMGISDAENYTNTLPAYGAGTGNQMETQLMFFNIENYQSGGVRMWATDLDESLAAYTSLWFR